MGPIPGDSEDALSEMISTQASGHRKSANTVSLGDGEALVTQERLRERIVAPGSHASFLIIIKIPQLWRGPGWEDLQLVPS